MDVKPFASADEPDDAAGDPLDVTKQSWRFDYTDRTAVTYDGTRFDCNRVASPNGEWTIAFGRASNDRGCRIFGFHEDELVYTVPIERPQEARIADNGTAAVVDAGGFGSSGGALVVVGADGQELLREPFSSNVHGVDITADGTYAAVVTLNPDCSVYVYDLAKGERCTIHEVEHGRRHGVVLKGDEPRVYIIDDNRERLLYAIDLESNVVWQSDYVESRMPFFTRLLGRFREWIHPRRESSPVDRR